MEKWPESDSLAATANPMPGRKNLKPTQAVPKQVVVARSLDLGNRRDLIVEDKPWLQKKCSPDIIKNKKNRGRSNGTALPH